MMDEDSTPPDSRGLDRGALEAVIRRAAQLAAGETEIEERLSEEDLWRIAEELGIPELFVRQALYEQQLAQPPVDRIDRFFGAPRLLVARTVTGDEQGLRAKLQAYLTDHEYLRLQFHRAGRSFFEPANDALSSIARTIRRPAKHFHLTRSPEVVLAVRPLDGTRSHVCFELDLTDRRRQALRSGIIAGVVFGMILAIPTFLLASAAASTLLGDTWGTVLGLGAAAGIGSAGTTATLAATAARFRKRLAAASHEVNLLLDRLQHGETLAPRSESWPRRLQNLLRLDQP